METFHQIFTAHVVVDGFDGCGGIGRGGDDGFTLRAGQHQFVYVRGFIPASGKTAAAQDADLLAGNIMDGVEIFGVTGSIPAGSDVTGTDGSLSFAIPDGYYSGKTATAMDADLMSEYIVEGVTIFGVTGSYRYGWNLHTNTPSTALYALAMLSSTDGWVAGAGGIYHFDGDTWSLHTDSPGITFYGMDILNSIDGWAVGSLGNIYHWDGASWSLHTTTGEGTRLESVSMVSSTEGWAVGTSGRIYRYSGGSWSLHSTTSAGSALYAVDMVNSNYGWAGDYNGHFYFWDGSS